MIIGLFLIVMGVLWILANIGIISADMSDFIWPIVLIAVGGQILWDHYRKSKNCCKKEK